MAKKAFPNEKITIGEAIIAQNTEGFSYLKKGSRIFYTRGYMILSANEMHRALARGIKLKTGKKWS